MKFGKKKNLITEQELTTVQDIVFSERKSLSKKSIGLQLWLSITNGELLTIKDIAKKYRKPESTIRAVLSRLWKRGYMLSPIVDKEGKTIVSPNYHVGGAYIKDVLEKEEYLITSLRRQRKTSLIPAIKRMVKTCEFGSVAFPELKSELLSSLKEDKKNLIELYEEVSK